MTTQDPQNPAADGAEGENTGDAAAANPGGPGPDGTANTPPQQFTYQPPQDGQQPPQPGADAPPQADVPPQGYQAPPQAQGYAAPGYQAPPQGGQQPGYQQGYQQPGYAQQPVSDPVGNVTLNYWLSVFFTWIPALIFFLIDKDRGNAQLTDYQRQNLNFSLTRVVFGLGYILVPIPVLGWILGILLMVAHIVLFIFHIIAAAKAPQGFRTGQQPGFIFAIPFIR